MILLAYYSSSTGGRTDTGQAAFPGRAAVPYLVSVADPYDSLSPLHRWRVPVALGRLERMFGFSVLDLRVHHDAAQYAASTVTLIGAPPKQDDHWTPLRAGARPALNSLLNRRHLARPTPAARRLPATLHTPRLHPRPDWRLAATADPIRELAAHRQVAQRRGRSLQPHRARPHQHRLPARRRTTRGPTRGGPGRTVTQTHNQRRHPQGHRHPRPPAPDRTQHQRPLATADTPRRRTFWLLPHQAQPRPLPHQHHPKPTPRIVHQPFTHDQSVTQARARSIAPSPLTQERRSWRVSHKGRRARRCRVLRGPRDPRSFAFGDLLAEAPAPGPRKRPETTTSTTAP